MKTKLFFVFAFAMFMLSSLNVSAQLVINIRYTGENGAARMFTPLAPPTRQNGQQAPANEK